MIGRIWARPEPYARIPEDWQRGMAVVAHPDDLEYGGAAAVARWTAHSVAYLLVTRGEAGGEVGIDSLPALGVPDGATGCRGRTEFLGRPDDLVEYPATLRRDPAAPPGLVVTGEHRETWPGGALNIADRRAVARLRSMSCELRLRPTGGVFLPRP